MSGGAVRGFGAPGAARYDGWAPFHTGGFARASRSTSLETVDDLATAITFVRSLSTDKDPHKYFDVCWSESLVSDSAATVDERCSRLRSLADAGVTWTTIAIPGTSRTEVLDGIAAFGREVIAESGRINAD